MKNKFNNIIKSNKTKMVLCGVLGFVVGVVIFSVFTNEENFTKTYYSIGSLRIEDGVTFACSSVTEASTYSFFDKKAHSSISKNPDNNFSLGINTQDETLSLITSTAVKAGINEPDKYKIISYEPGVSLSAVGYSGQSIVIVVLDLKQGTALVSKAGNRFGSHASAWLATCY